MFISLLPYFLSFFYSSFRFLPLIFSFFSPFLSLFLYCFPLFFFSRFLHRFIIFDVLSYLTTFIFFLISFFLYFWFSLFIYCVFVSFPLFVYCCFIRSVLLSLFPFNIPIFFFAFINHLLLLYIRLLLSLFGVMQLTH